MESSPGVELCITNRIKQLREKAKSVKPLNYKEFYSLLKNTEQISEESAAMAIVGLLLGFSSHLFMETEIGFEVKSGVSVGDLTNLSSQNFLQYFVEYGNAVRSLSSFCIDSRKQSIRNEISHSMIGYVYSLQELINRCVLGKLVYSFHEYLRNTPKPRLIHFRDFLHSKDTDFAFKKIRVLSQIHNSIVCNESFEFNSLCTANTLNVLFRQLCNCGEESRSIIWTLFLSVFRVTLNYLQTLLVSGVGNDVHKEFFVEFNETAFIENFWDACIDVNERSVPDFLKPYLSNIVIGVKSKLLLGTSPESIVIATQPQTTIFETFYAKFTEIYKNTSDTSTIHQPKIVSKILEETCLNLPRTKPLKNTKFNQEYKFLDVCNETTYKIEATESVDEYNFAPEFKLVPGIVSFEVAFDRALRFSLNQYIDPICAATVRYFLTNYLGHLKVMNENYLFLKCDHQLSIYFSSVFYDVTLSTGNGLFSSFWTDYSFADSGVRAFLSGTLREQCTRHEILSNLHFIYRETDHLSQSILNTEAFEMYDQSFQFLLELKYCKWLLENVELIKANTAVPLNCSDRQQWLLRFRFLGVVNFAHSSIMYRLQNAVETLISKNKRVNHYETLRQHFLDFERELQTITCQESNKISSLIKKVVRKMSQDAVCLWDLWHQSDCIKKQQFLSKLDVNLQRCQTILELYL